MFNNQVLNICSELYDRITVAKGYLQVDMSKANVDYSIIILQELNEMENMVNKIVDLIKLVGEE